MATTRHRRSGAAGLAVLVVAGLAAAGVALANGLHDTAAPSAVATTGAPGASPTEPALDGVVVVPRSGPDLPGADALARCRNDRRAAVGAYETAALGRVVLQCGDRAQGYEHIRQRHADDWADELGADAGRDWDDVMLTAVRTVLTSPRRGFPVDAGDGKVCYSAPIRIDEGEPPADPFVTVIVSATTDRVITAYPASRLGC